MVNKKNIKWDVKRGCGILKFINTSILTKWIKEGRLGKEDAFLWRRGMSGWRKPEDVDEFKKLFKKRETRRGKDNG